jgi:glutathione S-transferase
MTYILHSQDATGGAVVEIALALAGAEYKIVEVDTRSDRHLEEAFTRINPWRQVPVLELPDGTVITESAAMAIHVANAFPDAGLAPKPGTPAHAAFLRWMVFMAVNIYEADLRYYYPNRYTADPEGIEAVKTAALDHMRRGFRTMEDALAEGRYPTGDTPGIADVYLCMLRAWLPGEMDTPETARITAALRDHPIAGPIFTRHYPAA